MGYGINLFSLRNFIGTEKEFSDTALRLKAMGYSYLQFSGAPLDAAIVKRVTENTGMPVKLTHVPLDRIINDGEKLMEEHASFGCKNIGLGALPLAEMREDNAVKELIERLNTAGGLFKENGFSLYYHNHNYEFSKNSEGKTWFDYILENAENVYFTLDFYWVHYGGASVSETLNKAKGRVGCVHLKDYKTERSGSEFKPRFAAIGDGNMDIPRLIDTARNCGTEYFFVEQDDACDYPNPFGEVEKSIRFLLKR